MVKRGFPTAEKGVVMCRTETGHVHGRAMNTHYTFWGNVVGRSARGLLVMAAAGGCSSSVTDGSGHNMP